jgi:YgiT-type zinc finger domain-containing protein
VRLTPWPEIKKYMYPNISIRTGKEMTCDNCGKQGARIRRVARTYGRGKDIFVIENVPVVTCPHCGESYLEAETLHEIERIRLHKKSFSVNRSVPVVNFA